MNRGAKATATLWHDIVDSLDDSVIVVDRDLRPIAVNPAAETMLGVSKVGKTLLGGLMRQNEWLGRMLHSCLDTGQSLGDPEAIFYIGPRALNVRAQISPLSGVGGDSGGA